MNYIKKKISFLYKLFGKKYIVIKVNEGLKENEVLISGHKIFIKENEVNK